MSIEETCPKCGAPIVRNMVDIGVGSISEPACCERCGWDEMELVNQLFKLKEGL